MRSKSGEVKPTFQSCSHTLYHVSRVMAYRTRMDHFMSCRMFGSEKYTFSFYTFMKTLNNILSFLDINRIYGMLQKEDVVNSYTRRNACCSGKILS